MRYVEVIDEIFSRFSGPKFAIRFWDYKEKTYGEGKFKVFTLVFENEKAVKRLLSQGAVGFGEAYMDGSIRIEGDIDAYMRLRHQFKHVKPSFQLLKASLLARLTTPRSTTEQIAYHYDLGNDFFRLFLDGKTMSYSCAKYESADDSLGTAQQNKLALVCDWIDKPKGSNVLDLGSGWGGFAAYAAKRHAWKITGLTLSKAQLSYARKLIRQRKHTDTVSFKYQDMLRDLPNKQYDAIVMLESLEHVPKSELEDYFRSLSSRLKPGGSLYLQFTGRYKVGTVDKWTLKYVFPGGYLPAIGEVIGYAGEAGFRLDKTEVDTQSYIRTLSEWIGRIEANEAEITEKYGASFYRLWELWTHGARAAFEVNSMSLYRVKFTKHR